MNRELVLKYKVMFEQEKRNLLYSQKILNDDFNLPQDDLMDEVDLSSAETETSMRMRLRNREALYIKKLDEALWRITEGSFGECQECGEDIEGRRLEARPTATLCVSCKEDQEHRENIHIDGHMHKSVGTKLRLA